MTAKYISELEQAETYSLNDQIVIEQSDATRRSFLFQAVDHIIEQWAVISEILYHPDTGANYHLLDTSGTITKSGLIALAQTFQNSEGFSPPLAQVTAERLLINVACCGGGGGGAWGGSTGYGGFPGVVTKKRIRVSDLPDGDIPFVIGAGGVAGGPGGTTVFGNVAQPSSVFYIMAQGGQRGGNTDAEEKMLASISMYRGYNHPLVDRTTSTSDSVNTAMSNPFGPGGGGSQNANKSLSGGYGGYNGLSNSNAPGTNGAPGGAHQALLFDSWGAGGGGYRGTGTGSFGGRGGFPGGGGGGCPQSSQSGPGGNGAIKIQFELETLKRIS